MKRSLEATSTPPSPEQNKRARTVETAVESVVISPPDPDQRPLYKSHYHEPWRGLPMELRLDIFKYALKPDHGVLSISKRAGLPNKQRLPNRQNILI